ncbi:AAA family ATPase [Empedobacter brevis]|uniref:AAA family ATPase n=1 Tax=Empedobacter brevis TaxID=247 RepID=UPI0033406B14
MEKIYIKGFGGIKNSSFEINKINILIGKSASGKSVSIKLIYFFKNIFREFFDCAENEANKHELNKKLLSIFEDFFPSESWKDSIFEIKYFYNSEDFACIHKATIKSKINITYSSNVIKQFYNAKNLIKKDKEKFQSKDKFEIYRPDYKVFEKYLDMVRTVSENSSFSQIFIPAGRSFFATLQSSIFSFLSNNKAIDPFLIKFGSFYENIKGISTRPRQSSPKKEDNYINDLILQILGGKYERIKNKDYIVHEDKRLINLAYASSGQQETLPLALILKALTRINFIGDGLTLYIEEPEAHLFPAAQKKVVELIISVFQLSRCQSQILITTHSPYIISSFNNLLQAGLVYEDESKREKLSKIISSYAVIKKGFLNAISVENNSFNDIVDTDYGLIDSIFLDNISAIISNEFNELIELENDEL